MARILEELELDDWFQAEKERLSDRLLEALQKGADEGEAKALFEKEFKQLLRRYDERYRRSDAARARRERRRVPFRRITARWNRLLAGLRERRLLLVERWKERRFQRAYEKLFPSRKKKI